MTRGILGMTTLGLVAAATVATAGGDVSIYDIQYYGTVLENEIVDVNGVVVTGVYFNGFFAQEPDEDTGLDMVGRRFSGIWCYNGSTPVGLEVGDVVDINGEYYEYFDESELDLTSGSGYTVVGTAALPPIQNLLITDLNNDSSTAEDWEGVLVEVTQPNMISSDTLGAGCASSSPTRWAVLQTSSPGDSLFVRNSVGTHEIPVTGSPITYIQGPMSFYQCNRNIMPRDNDDIGYIAPPNIVWAYSTSETGVDIVFSRDVTAASAEDESNYFFTSGSPDILDAVLDADGETVHLTTGPQSTGAQDEIFAFNIQSAGGATMPGPQSFQFFTGVLPISAIQFVDDPGGDDASEFLSGVVTVNGVATHSNIDTDNTDFVIADAAGPWNGIFVDLVGDNVAVGDMVQVSGRVTEGFGMTRIQFTGFGRAVNMGPGTPIAPTILSPEDLPYDDIELSEQYECVLVTLANAVLDTEGSETGFGEYWALPATPAPGDTAMIDFDDSMIADDFAYEPSDGDEGSFTGNVLYAFSSYRLIPRNDDDVEVEALAVGMVTSPRQLELRNSPNPFNPQTHIRFRIPSATVVKLEIHDPQGRLVRTLIQGEELAGGEHSVTWDGTTDAGQPVGSGTYFYRVLVDGQAVTNQMTLLK
jgi:hypothetical protein